MQRFRTVLVYPSGLNRGDPAIATASDLARRTQASLTIAWILDPSVPNLDMRKQERRGKLRALIDELVASGIQADPLLLVGAKPSKVLAEQIEQNAFDLVVKTARPGDQERDRAFSETAKRLLREAPCPVWIVRTPPPDTPTRILAAIAPYHHHEESRELDQLVLDIASQLAEVRSAELNIVSAWRPIAAKGRITSEERHGYLREGELDARRSLNQFLVQQGHTLSKGRIHFHVGTPAEGIASVAYQIGAELIVVGAAARKGLSRWILGNTVEDVLDAGTGDVMGVGRQDDAKPPED